MGAGSTRPRHRAGVSVSQSVPSDSPSSRASAQARWRVSLPPRTRGRGSGDELHGLQHALLTREEELEVAKRIVERERALMDLLVESPRALATLTRIRAEVLTGVQPVDRVVRDAHRKRELAEIQRRRVLRVLLTANTILESLGASDENAQLQRKFASQLVRLKLHPKIIALLVGEARGGGDAESETEERSRAIAHAQREIERSKQVLITHNLRLVVKMAGKYRHRGLALTDLVQEGTLGLMHAIDKFDHRRGHRLSTYATWWIRQNIERALADQGATIRIPVHLVETAGRLRRAQRRFRSQHGVEATPEQLAILSGVSLPKVNAVSALPREPASLDAPLGERGDLRVGDLDLLPHADDASPAPSTESLLERKQMIDRARLLLEGLGDRERQVLRFRFGLDGVDAKTLDEIGQSLRLTRERIRQIEKRALEKLRAWSSRSSEPC